MTPRSQRLLANQHAAARPPRAIVHHRPAASGDAADLWLRTCADAEFVARVKACARLLELGAAHVVVAFALLRGELPRGAAR